MSLYYRGRAYEELHPPKGLSADRQLLRALWKLATPVKSLLGFAFVLMLADTAADLARPYMMKLAIDQYIATKDLPGLDRLFFIYMATIVASLLLAYGENLLLQKAGQQVILAVREKVFTHILNQRVENLESQPVGRLVTRVTNDTDAVKDLYTEVIVAFASDAVMLIGIITAMLLIHWKLALLSFLVLPLMVLLAAGYQKYARRAYRSVREKTAALNSFIQERLNGIGVIKAFGVFSVTGRDFRRVNDEYLQAGLAEMRTFAAFRPLVDIIYIAAVILVIYFGEIESRTGGIELGILIAFLRYMEKFFWPIKDMAEKYSLLQSALAAAERIQPMLTEPERIFGAAVPIQRCPAARIEFEDVWFAYEADEWVLTGVSFVVPAGNFYGIVGLSGSGKTTLLSLLLRFYEPQKGRILLDGVDIRELPVELLRHRVSIVFQEVHIFKGSVAENISLYNPLLSREQVREAAIQANLDPFVEKMPQGYDTQAGYLGSTLSGGQRQLLSFARALVTPADVLVLDEATSSIDSYTESLVQAAMEKAAAHRTLLVVAHRLSTVVKADCILLMHGGKVVEQGTHDQLMFLNGQYARLYKSQ
ncbi:MAG: ABC transporter ATP-binding protein [Negativicutes bacterium]